MQTEYTIQDELITLHRKIHNQWWIDIPNGTYWVERFITRKGREQFILKSVERGHPKDYVISRHDKIEKCLLAYLEDVNEYR